VTPAPRFLRASRRRSAWSRGWRVPCALSAVAVSVVPAVRAHAQGRPETPITPSAAIGSITDAATVSVLGIAALPDGSGNALTRRNDVWLGATQPLGRLGRVRFAALGSGSWHMPDGVGSGSGGDGVLALRARARMGEHRVWSAISYGQSSLNGSAAAALVGQSPLALAAGGIDGRGSDTTVSRRIDVGRIGRAEAGVMTTYAGLELSFGMSMERATRVTTQTITVDEPNTGALPAAARRMVSSRSLRTLQRRDLATGIASLGFHTGATGWLVSVSAPVASWVSSDALAPRPQAVPTVASVAVAQPVTGWLSVVGAAATNPGTVGGTALRDELSDRPRQGFSPVVALGIRISRLPWRRDDGTPGGILGFETRTLGAVDSVSIEQGMASQVHTDTDTLRVVLLIDAPRAESVELMGDATAWTVTPLKRHPSGRWRAELKLPPGMHRIAIRADGGTWVAPPGVPTGNDDFGSPVGMLLVKGRHTP
jgi:hypothetical protein